MAARRSPSSHPSATSDSSDRWLRIGALLIGLGVGAAVATLVPLFTGADPLPVAAYLLTLLAPLGLAVVLGALWRRALGRHARLAASGHASGSAPHRA